MWLCPVLGLLAGAALLTPLGTSDVLFGVSHPHLPSFLLSFRALVLLSCGPHSLRYNLTALSQDGSVQSRFVTQGYLDGRPFLHYEHGKGRAEPWRTWAEAVLGAETWDTETEALTEMGKDLRMALADIMALQTLKREPVKLQVQ